MRKKTRGIICFLLSILLILLPTFGTQASGGRDILGKGTDYTAILYDSSNGLPTSEANAIAQTGNGFIWFGGYSGLIRYDGTNFKRIDSSGGISSVFSLFVDSKDRLWIGTNENGLAYMENGEPFVYGRSEALQSYSIRDITEDKNGNILVATTQGMAYVGEDMELHPIDDPQIKTEYVNQLEKDASGNIFGLTLNGAIFQMNDLRISAFYEPDEFGDDPVNCIYADPVQPSIIYMGTQGEEILTASFGRSMNITAKDNCSPLKNINDMLRIGDYLWVCATGGVGYFNEKNRFYMIDDSPINSSVGDIMQDMEGNLWFTSTRQGIMKLVADRFTDITKLANLDPMVVNSTCVNDGALYLGTDKGLTIVNLSTYRTRTNEITELLTDVRIRCIKNDSRGNLWFCTHGDHGLVCYDPKTGSIKEYNSANGLEASRVRAVLELSDGSMAAATGDGLFIVNNGRVVANYGKDNGISTTEILSVAEDDNGRIYLGSDGDGIYVIDKNKVSRIGYEDGLTSEVVMRIKKDEKRNMFWLITSNSIEYMKDGVVTAVSNFPYSNNYDIYFDDKDGAWILASNGIYITEVEDLIANKNIDYSFYNIKSGLPYITTGNSRNHLDKDGKLYISGTTGTCAVNINADSTSTENVLLAIPSVELDDKTVNISEGDTVSIPAGCKRLVINGYALTYGLSNPRITYYLDGFDKEPVHTMLTQKILL
ncbi:MAG: hypothetical protein K6E33_06610 [Lachnospiraceae bacterium]|nr:hypothetical protein [Lachnospiraceae bacterium]